MEGWSVFLITCRYMENYNIKLVSTKELKVFLRCPLVVSMEFSSKSKTFLIRGYFYFTGFMITVYVVEAIVMLSFPSSLPWIIFYSQWSAEHGNKI